MSAPPVAKRRKAGSSSMTELATDTGFSSNDGSSCGGEDRTVLSGMHHGTAPEEGDVDDGVAALDASDGEADDYDEDEDDDDDDSYMSDNVSDVDAEEVAALNSGGIVCLDSADVLDEALHLTDQLREVGALSEDDAAHILFEYRWNVDRSIAAVCEDRDKALEQAGVPVARQTADVEEADSVCTVCFGGEEDGVSLKAPLPCKHTACDDCWKRYITTKVEEGFSLDITCIGHGCQRRVPRSLCLALLDTAVSRKYNNLITQLYIDAKKSLKWCPAPECDTVVQMRFSTASSHGSVVCRRCNKPFCFGCGEYHAPATCKMMKVFVERKQADGSDVAWLTKNAKECPKCSAFIEKAGGCNWVKCYKCKFEFCWLCLRHMLHREVDAAGGNHKCNVYKEGEEDEVASRRKKAEELRMKDDRRRFGHFLQRYLAHDESLKLEMLLRHKLGDSPQTSQEHFRALREALLTGLERLQMARMTLKSSYVLAFYQPWTKGNSRKEIFEDLQNLLETRTEALSKSIEDALREVCPDTTPAEHDKHRAEVLSQMDAVGVNMKNLVDVCERDLTQVPDGVAGTSS